MSHARVLHGIKKGNKHKPSHQHSTGEQSSHKQQLYHNMSHKKVIGEAVQAGAIGGGVLAAGGGFLLNMYQRLACSGGGEIFFNRCMNMKAKNGEDVSLQAFITVLLCMALYASAGYFNQPAKQLSATSENEEAAEEKRQYKRY